MSSLEKITGRKRHARNVYNSLIGSPALAEMPADYVGPAGLTRRDIIEKIERLGSCCSSMYLAEMQGGGVKIHKGDFCKQHIICGTCASRIQNLRRKRLTPAIRDLAGRADPKYKGPDKLYVYLVTFTVKDGPGVLETYSRLKNGMKNFRKAGQDRPIYRKGKKVGVRRGSGEWSRVVAGCGTTEAKRGEESGEAHIHNHAILFTDSKFNYVVYDQSALFALEKKYGRGNIPDIELKKIELRENAESKFSAEWKAATGDSTNIDVTPLYRIPRNRPGRPPVKPETVAKCAKMNFQDSISYQAREVLKYAAKVESQDIDFSLQLINELHNKRFFDTWGLLRGLNDENNYDESEVEPGESITGIYHVTWNDSAGEYAAKVAADDPGIDDQYIGVYGLYRYKQNQIVGTYRSERAAMVRAGATAAALNARRDLCRSDLKTLWQGYKVDKCDGAYIKALGLNYEKPEKRFSYTNFMFLNFHDPVRLEMLKEVHRNYLNKILYSCTKTENQKRIEESESDF